MFKSYFISQMFKGVLYFSLMRRHGKIYSTSLLRHSKYIEKHKDVYILISYHRILLSFGFLLPDISATKHILF